MSELKRSLRVERIPNVAAVKLLNAKHPLGAGQGFTFALGVFWCGRCEGVMTFGNPISNLAVHRYGLRQCDSLELRKLWMTDVPPKNSESRALSVAIMLIKKHYPQIQIVLTYCDESESAVAYKAAGWIPQDAHRYVREVKYNGRWLSMRDANRLRVTSLAEEVRHESRRKWVYPLSASVAQLVEQSPPRGSMAVRSRPGRSDLDQGDHAKSQS